MHNVDDLDTVLEAMIAEAQRGQGFDWKYMQGQARDRDLDAPEPERSIADEPGLINGVSKSTWEAMSPEEQQAVIDSSKKAADRARRRQEMIDKLSDDWAAKQEAPAPSVDAPTASAALDTARADKGLPTGAVAQVRNKLVGPKGQEVGGVVGDSDILSRQGYYVLQDGTPVAGPYPNEVKARDMAMTLGEHDADKAGIDGLRKRRRYIASRGYSLQLLPNRSYSKLARPKSKEAPVQGPTTPVNTGEKATFSSQGRVVADQPENLERGFYVVNDQYPEIPLDGPYAKEIDAQRAMHKVMETMVSQELSDYQADNGAVNDEVKARLVDQIQSRISYQFMDPKARERNAGREKTTSGYERRYEYGAMREKQLEMLASGRIQEVRDDNPDPSYIDGTPTLENLKKVFCPLILDKAKSASTEHEDGTITQLPPRKPWTLKQVIWAMWPIINRMVTQWTGGGFTYDEAIDVCLTAIMKALINDRGMSPFPAYAARWLRGDLYRAKKTEGMIKRPSREKGWGNQGLSSTDNPLLNAEGGEEGTLGDTVGADSPTYEKIDCPDCGGKGVDQDGLAETCTYCNGAGVDGVDNKGQPKKCALCKGRGNIPIPCRSCGGTGKIILSGQKDWGMRGGVDVTGDAKSGYHVHGDIDTDEKAEIVERLNRAAQLVKRLMDEAKLTPKQRQALALRFGMDSLIDGEGLSNEQLQMIVSNFGIPRTQSQVADILGVSKIAVDTAIKNSLTKVRKALLHTRDEDLFNAFEEYQKEYKLKDLSQDADPKHRYICTDPDCGWQSIAKGGASDVQARRHQLETGHKVLQKSPLEGWAMDPSLVAADKTRGDQEDVPFELPSDDEAKAALDSPSSPWWIRTNPELMAKYGKKKEIHAPLSTSAHSILSSLSSGAATPDALSLDTGLPRASLDRVLDNLKVTGLIIPDTTEPGGFRITPKGKQRLADIGLSSAIRPTKPDPEKDYFDWPNPNADGGVNPPRVPPASQRMGEGIPTLTPEERAELFQNARQMANECVNLMDRLHLAMIMEEVESGEIGEEALLIL